MRTLLVCRSAHDTAVSQLRDCLRSACDDKDPTVALYEGAERQVLRLKPEFIVVALSGDIALGHEVIRTLREATEARILAVGPITDSKLILHTLQVGADLFLDSDERETEFTKAVGRLFPKHNSGLTTGRLLAVISACGGCGASTLAVNFAALLAHEHGKCGLIDLHPGRGDLAALLDVEAQFSLVDVCLNEPRLDRGMLAQMFTQHASGIHLLAAPQTYADVRRITTTAVKQALSLSRMMFRETVVDLEDCIHAEQVEALRQATSIFVATRLDFTALRNARRLIDCLYWLDIPRNHVQVVVNHQGQPNELPIDEAEKALGQKLAGFVPYDPKTIMAANNTGIPAVLKAPGTPLVHAIGQLVSPFIEKPPEPSSGFLKKVASMMWKSASEPQWAGQSSSSLVSTQLAGES